MQPVIICLMGPTASGKSDLAFQLAKHLSCELVSVDSALVYKDMNIGTAKPSLEHTTQIKHHLIDLCDPSCPYSAAQFEEEAMATITSLLAKSKRPLLVGGTMLYFHALQKGLSPLPAANPTIRAQLNTEGNRIGWAQMHERLAKVDPLSASRINPNDPQRIQRALEVYELTQRTLTDLWQSQHSISRSFRFLNIAIAPSDRTVLHEKIAVRFKCMLEQGFIEEVEQLLARPNLHKDLPSMRAVGYRQIWQYLEGLMCYEEMCEKAITATRQLAKRQLTWLRRWEDVKWFETDDKLFHHVMQYLREQLYFSS